MNSVVVSFRPDGTTISPRWGSADEVADRGTAARQGERSHRATFAQATPAGVLSARI
jgi:hypothetical protein